MSANATLTLLGPGDFNYCLTDMGEVFESRILKNTFYEQMFNCISK